MTERRCGHRRWFGVAGLVAVVLVLGACGSSGPTDEERMDAALLRLSDFPADDGWAIEPEPTDDPEFDAAVDACRQAHDPAVDFVERERSFTRGEFDSVLSAASVVPNQDVRDKVFLAFDMLVECYASAVEESWLKDAPAGVTVNGSDPYALEVSTAADRTRGRAIQLGMYSETYFLDLILLEQGSSLLSGAFWHKGELTAEKQEDIFAPAVKRIKEL